MPIIVNADDFGKSEDVNRAICEAFEKKLIHRTTLMANMPYAQEAMELAARKGFLDRVGIHLNLTEGHPLTKSMANNREMCDESGRFTADFHRNTKKRFFLCNKTKKDIKEELDAQFSKYKELGGVLFHVDSHHHVHTDASVLSCLEPLLANYNVKSIRLGRNLYKGGNPLMRLYKKWLNRRLGKYEKCCRYFGRVEDYEEYNPSKGFVKENVIEIMVHPMYSENGELIDTYYPMSLLSKRLGGNI